MTTHDTAVTFYVLGLVSGMIVAFASCSSDPPDYTKQQQQQHSQSPAHTSQFR